MVTRVIRLSVRITCCDSVTGKVDWSPLPAIITIGDRKKYFRSALNVWIDKNWKRVLAKVKRDGNVECYETFHSGEKGSKDEHKLKICDKSVRLLEVWDE